MLIPNLLAAPVAAQPATDNRDTTPIELEADSADISLDKRTAVYSGNAVVIRANHRLYGDTVTVSYTDESAIEHAQIVGSPALWQYQKTIDKLYQGSATNIDYFVSEQRLLFSGNAEANTDLGLIRGEQIEHNLSTGNTKVLSKKDERVKIIYHHKIDQTDNP
ncbi:MAG: lipopolysaccharide transport periplasmic protein LptA [Candidatus Porifericomitaceae bacterium WSBS_2022_MAG_OTU9]